MENQPVDFRIPATDTKGHSVRFWFRAMPAISRQVEQIINSRKFPYRTKGDLIRHAMHRHLNWLSEIDDVPSVTVAVDAMIEVLRDDEFEQDFHLLFGKLATRVHQHMESGDEDSAKRLVMRIYSKAKEIPDRHYRDKYITELRRRYGYHIDNAKRAALREVDDE